ncbi:hypothetical protein ACFQZE_23790 [Paenibacillus sp. GCM10027627]|uniref:hypothetical protein n=1 Tax=unclassified Paenibacillus TaxID=185978 RepID=UPI00363B2B93
MDKELVSLGGEVIGYKNENGDLVLFKGPEDIAAFVESTGHFVKIDDERTVNVNNIKFFSFNNGVLVFTNNEKLRVKPAYRGKLKAALQQRDLEREKQSEVRKDEGWNG